MDPLFQNAIINVFKGPLAGREGRVSVAWSLSRGRPWNWSRCHVSQGERSAWGTWSSHERGDRSQSSLGEFSLQIVDALGVVLRYAIWGSEEASPRSDPAVRGLQLLLA